MSKIIVGQGLNLFINNKEKEKLFSKKYQVLSKNTVLYAEITNLNDLKQKKLITVDLNKYNKYNIEDNLINLDSFQFKSMNFGGNNYFSFSSLIFSLFSYISFVSILSLILQSTQIGSSDPKFLLLSLFIDNESKENDK